MRLAASRSEKVVLLKVPMITNATLGNGLGHWLFPVPLSVFVALTGVFYGRGWLRVRSVHPDVASLRKIAAFAGGLVVLLIVTGSPLAALDHELLLVHMVQHILLMAVAPPLLLLGSPVLMLAYGLPKHFVQGVVNLFRNTTLVRLSGRVLFHPVTCWLVATITVVGWHTPAAFELGLRSPGWHEIQRTSFFAAGVLFWWPVIQPWPSASPWMRWSAPVYLFAATLPCDALSAFLTFCDRVVYRPYLTMSHAFQYSALHDQEWAGVLMWVCVTFIYMVPAMLISIDTLMSVETPLSETEIGAAVVEMSAIQAIQIEAI
jgi:putative membrane protein